MANLRFPVYIISKGRWESRMTSKALDAIGVPYRIVVEPQEFHNYSAVIDSAKILTLPFSNLGQGSIPARNWVWEHSLLEGHKKHWILDDNIAWFARYNRNKKYHLTSGVGFVCVEDLCEKYENVSISGIQYDMFVPSTIKKPPLIINTRVYSCILIKNSIPHRWRGRYNEDTDLCLRVLKDGHCTILVQAFVCKKMTTLKMKGGNTESLYKLGNGVDGRLLMAQSLQQQHPDIVKIGRRYGRWQHVVDYRPFKRNKLILKNEFVGKKWEPNEYGMKLVKLGEQNSQPQSPSRPGPYLRAGSSAALPAQSQSPSEPRAKRIGAASKPQL